jgi:ABC-type glycerol-3-phosphate transport system substrate-binding protein
MTSRINARGLTRNGRAVYGFATLTTGGELAARLWIPFLLSSGGKLLDESGNSAIHTSEAVEALALHRRLIESSQLPMQLTQWDLRKIFAVDRIGFMLEGASGRGFFRKWSGLGKAFDDHFGIAPIPAGPGGRSATIAFHHSIALSNQTRCPEECLHLIETLLADPVLARIYHEKNGLIPARKSFLALPEYQGPYAQVILQQALAAQPLPCRHPHFFTAMTILGKALHHVITGHADPAQTLKKAASDMNVVLHCPEMNTEGCN